MAMLDMDGTVWDGKDAKEYATGFEVSEGCKELDLSS